jgi:hypothetical protein
VEQALSQLRKAIDTLIKNRWSEPLRRRAEERAGHLVTACRRARVHRATRVAQALQALVKLEEEDLDLIHGPLQDKLFELLALVRTLAACG